MHADAPPMGDAAAAFRVVEQVLPRACFCLWVFVYCVCERERERERKRERERERKRRKNAGGASPLPPPPLAGYARPRRVWARPPKRPRQPRALPRAPRGACPPPLPTVAPTHVPTVHSPARCLSVRRAPPPTRPARAMRTMPRRVCRTQRHKAAHKRKRVTAPRRPAPQILGKVRAKLGAAAHAPPGSFDAFAPGASPLPPAPPALAPARPLAASARAPV